MADDLFKGLEGLGGLGGLMKGLSGFMPQDNPDVKIFNEQQELSDLQKKEAGIYEEIGRSAYAQNPSVWPQSDKLKLIQSEINTISEKLNAVKKEKEMAQAAQAADEEKRRCKNCNTLNPDGVKFCQECGSPLAAPAKSFCTACGAEMTPGARFCGECGAKGG